MSLDTSWEIDMDSAPLTEERSFSLFNEVRSRGGFLELGAFLGVPTHTHRNLSILFFFFLVPFKSLCLSNLLYISISGEELRL